MLLIHEPIYYIKQNIVVFSELAGEVTALYHQENIFKTETRYGIYEKEQRICKDIRCG